jgi:hypothetical protein
MSKVIHEAAISPDGAYRYMLGRAWDPNADKGFAIFVMLNPSTADLEKDDATIRRCTHFARNWGHGGICVYNLYAYRTTFPEVLRQVSDPVGPENDEWLRRAATIPGRVIVAWGRQVAHPVFGTRDEQVLGIFKEAGRQVYCFGKTKEGYPKHPVRLAKNTMLSVYREGEHD